ncbi:unnamed protein product [Caenorhabditis auriculariae]|uniref:Uncharacterized protein n=1 Tax=Caenorhabditis auriculariae TaxID=2777116 RepID=A0A8S1H1A2_9PELO|nr:unnamed protein product [Caenorhabditis auriculariae]
MSPRRWKDRWAELKSARSKQLGDVPSRRRSQHRAANVAPRERTSTKQCLKRPPFVLVGDWTPANAVPSLAAVAPRSFFQPVWHRLRRTAARRRTLAPAGGRRRRAVPQPPRTLSVACVGGLNARKGTRIRLPLGRRALGNGGSVGKAKCWPDKGSCVCACLALSTENALQSKKFTHSESSAEPSHSQKSVPGGLC